MKIVVGMETTGDRHSNMQLPTELDLFKAEIFDSSSDEDDDVRSPTPLVATRQSSDTEHIASMNHDIIIPSQAINPEQHSIVAIMTSRLRPDDVYGDDVTNDLCDDASGSDCSVSVSSRRSSSHLGGDATPKIDEVQLASALSRVSAVVTPVRPLTPSDATTLGDSERSHHSVPTIKRIDVTSSTNVGGDTDEATLHPSLSIDKNDGGVAIKSSLWQPMKPGYSPNIALTGGHDMGQAVLIRRTVAVERNVVTTEQESSFRLAIPVMSRHVAMFCAVLNVLSPGLGTFISGLTLMCGSRLRLRTLDRTQVIWTNLWVAFLQLITAPLLLLGWIWSLVWATSFISISKSHIEERRSVERTESDSSSRSSRPPTGSGVFPTSGTTCTTTTTTTLSIQPEAPLIIVNGTEATTRTSASVDASATSPAPPQGSTSPDGSELIMYTGLLNHVRPPIPGVFPQHRRRRSRQLNSHYGAGSMNVAPEVLLTPGALETIVINNGAFFVSGTNGSTPTTPNGVGEQPQFLVRGRSSSRDSGVTPYAGKADGRQY